MTFVPYVHPVKSFLSRRALVLLGSAILSAGAARSQAPAGGGLPRVNFDSLPPGWMAKQLNVMDGIWQPLGVRGVNYYSYGAPTQQGSYAARSDPDSPLYQAWLGAYVVVGALDSASADSSAAQQRWVVALAERDQRSWLQAMGDPSPQAQTILPLHLAEARIAGAPRRVFEGEMKSHSDLSAAGTPLATAVGMPPELDWMRDLVPFHDVVLHVQAAVWYDRARHVTIIVYAASSQFRTKDGKLSDNGPRLDPVLRAAMGRVHVVSDGP